MVLRAVSGEPVVTMVADGKLTLRMPAEFNKLVSQTSPSPGAAGEMDVNDPVPPAANRVNCCKPSAAPISASRYWLCLR